MANRERGSGDRRRRGDRRTGKDRRCGDERRSGQDRRSGLDRRSGSDRRSRWHLAEDERFQGVLRTAETVAHLFSQPLTVIMGYVDLLAVAAREPESQKKLKIIKEQLEVLTAYLQNLRELTEYRTVDFGDVTLLDIASTKGEDHT